MVDEYVNMSYLIAAMVQIPLKEKKKKKKREREREKKPLFWKFVSKSLPP